MAAMPHRPCSTLGLWHITEMELWDADFLNMEVRAYIRFDKDGRGEFQFGLVHGNMDCQFGDESGQPFVEFTWSGNDEMDPAEGRGFAVLKKNDRLKGRIYFHQGDKSAFKAVRAEASAAD